MRWAGRMEEIMPGVFVDGAHNEDGIEAFVQSLEKAPQLAKVKGDDRCVLIFSVVKDKQYDKMIEMLCGLSMVTDFVITHIPGERGADLAKLQDIFCKYAGKTVHAVHTFEYIEDAVSFGSKVKGDGGVVYIAGSLYLAGLVLRVCPGKS